MNYNEKLIEEAAKALTALTDAEWEIATGEGTEHLAGYFDAARRVLAVFEKAHTPTDGEREALISAAHKEADQRYGVTDWTDGPGSSTFRRVDRGKAGAFVEGALWNNRRSEVPEPRADWYDLAVKAFPWDGSEGGAVLEARRRMVQVLTGNFSEQGGAS